MEKLKPLVIQKSLKSRCFKGIDVGKLRVKFKANSKAWLTMSVMTDWLQRFDNILLFLDNATSLVYQDFDNFKYIFFS